MTIIEIRSGKCVAGRIDELVDRLDWRSTFVHRLGLRSQLRQDGQRCGARLMEKDVMISGVCARMRCSETLDSGEPVT